MWRAGCVPALEQVRFAGEARSGARWRTSCRAPQRTLRSRLLRSPPPSPPATSSSSGGPLARRSAVRAKCGPHTGPTRLPSWHRSCSMMQPFPTPEVPEMARARRGGTSRCTSVPVETINREKRHLEGRECSCGARARWSFLQLDLGTIDFVEVEAKSLPDQESERPRRPWRKFERLR